MSCALETEAPGGSRGSCSTASVPGASRCRPFALLSHTKAVIGTGTARFYIQLTLPLCDCRIDVLGRVVVASCAVVAAIVAEQPTPARAQALGHWKSQHAEYRPFTTNNAALRASLDRLFARSAAWREAVDRVGRTFRRAHIVTPNQVRMIDPRDGGVSLFDTSVLAEALPIYDEDLSVDVVIVVVNLPLLEALHGYQGSTMDFEADLDGILAHEIYGHAVPYLLAGHMSGRCPDPSPGEAAPESCAIQRENEIRAQVGLGRRTEYGLDGLASVRRFGHRQIRH